MRSDLRGCFRWYYHRGVEVITPHPPALRKFFRSFKHLGFSKQCGRQIISSLEEPQASSSSLSRRICRSRRCLAAAILTRKVVCVCVCKLMRERTYMRVY